ncbi:hypothetical protein WOLCODRAFT_38711, partial [Wolfiporia cocos MD-104 SS10]
APDLSHLKGETGTGKTTVLSLIANVLKGHSPSEYEKFYEESNEAGGSQKGSQTNNAKLYEFSSTNGIRVRILDTPGLADTRGIRLDEQHKESIAREIQSKITAINAVIILANGTVPRLGVATDYTLSTLSSMFPTSLANNISFLFTNVSSPLNWNFEVESLPDVLRNNPVYLLDNPVAMQEKYVKEKQKGKAEGKVNKSLIRSLKKTVEEGHKKALGELVKIFDWIDTLSAQPTRGILTLYNQSQTIEMKIANALATMDQMTERKQVLQTIERESDGTKLTMEQYKQFQSTLRQKVYKRIDTTYHNTLCLELKCYNNCHEHCDLDFSLDPERLRGCVAFGGSERMQECIKCKHRYENHRHYHARWELTEDVQTTIDEEAKKKYEDAADKNERQKRRMKQLKNTIEDLDKALANATSEVGELVDEYAKLSLSGSFAGQVKKSVALLDSHLETMRGNGTDAETIKSVEKSLKLMEGKLKLVENA